MSGCPNNCCANQISEIGLAGRLTRDDGVLKQHYHILLGGSYGIAARQGRIIEENIPAENIPSKLAQLVTTFQKIKDSNETFGEFCSRLSKSSLQRYLRTIGVNK